MSTLVTNQPKAGILPALQFQKPQTFTLPNGLKVLVVPNHTLPQVTYQLQIDQAPFTEGNKKGLDTLTSLLMGKGTQNISKEAFFDEIDFLGFQMNFHTAGALAVGLSKYAARLLELFAYGCLNPHFTQEELDLERNKIIETLQSNEKNIQHTLARIENAITFGKHHPNGEITTIETLNQVTLQDIQNHYKNYFCPQQAYLVVIGDVDFHALQAKVTTLFSNWNTTNPPSSTYNNAPEIPQTQINWVDMNHAVQTEISITHTLQLPMTSPDYFPLILANQILGGGADGRLFLNLREKHGWTYGAYSTISAGKYTQKFKISTQVRHQVVSNAILEILKEIQHLCTHLVTDPELQLAKSKYIGNFIMQSQKPEAIARYALHTEIQKLPSNFYENYIQNISRVTPQEILRVTKNYFSPNHCHIFAVGQGEQIKPQLEKTGLKTNQYTPYAIPL